jgi:hypothetical protein
VSVFPSLCSELAYRSNEFNRSRHSSSSRWVVYCPGGRLITSPGLTSTTSGVGSIDSDIDFFFQNETCLSLRTLVTGVRTFVGALHFRSLFDFSAHLFNRRLPFAMIAYQFRRSDNAVSIYQLKLNVESWFKGGGYFQSQCLVADFYKFRYCCHVSSALDWYRRHFQDRSLYSTSGKTPQDHKRQHSHLISLPVKGTHNAQIAERDRPRDRDR